MLCIFSLLIVSIASQDCLLNYNGKISTTISGRECQRWDQEYPHEPRYTPKHKGHNHCRNPDDDPKGPWCYTTDPLERFEYCHITDCNDGTENTCWQPDDVKYKGTLSQTRSGIECQRWDKVKPHRPRHRPRKYKSQKNYCRNPDNDPEGPWCYTMDPEVRYDYCDIPKCENAETDTDSSSVSNDSYDDWIVQDDYEYSIDWHALLGEIFGGEMSEGNPFDADYEAYDYNNTEFEEYREDYNEQNNCQSLHLSEPGSDYNGTVSETSTGRKCRNWSQIDGFEHYGDHNYCRNLGFSANDAPGGIWCYTTDTEVRWEYCDQVKICQEETSDISVSQGTCGVSAVDVVWGREARLAGLPSKLTSRGKLLTPRRRNRRASRHNRSRKPMTWMEMIKEYRNNPQPETRIMGGNPADEKVWPWQVAFRLRDNGKLFCGGSLISSKYVLSAAHCFEQVRSRHVFVTAGHVSKGYQRAGREPGFQQYALEKLIPHEAYDNNIIYTDIALAKIHGEWQMTEYVRPACLPESSFSTSDSAVCVITGWGKTDGNKDLLNQATMPVINFQRCRRLLDYAVKDHTQFCAGVVDKGGVDTCQGDSGGPLMCNSGGVWKVVGITSWGYGCGEKNSPGVYTAVAKYRQWINYWLER